MGIDPMSPDGRRAASKPSSQASGATAGTSMTASPSRRMSDRSRCPGSSIEQLSHWKVPSVAHALLPSFSAAATRNSCHVPSPCGACMRKW
eukprot:366228-Chlamydomonas_euryale.AAC.38